MDGKKINSNQLVLLRVGTQIHLGEHPQEFTLSGKNQFDFEEKRKFEKEMKKNRNFC